MTRALVFAIVVGSAATSASQPRGGVLQATIVNGTTGEPGSAEKVTLLRLGSEMTPVQEIGPVSGRFEMTGIELEGQRPMLLQVSAAGVNYNQPVDFGRGYEAQAEVTVYDAFDEWDDAVLTVTTSRFLYRREGDRLRVDKVFVVENTSDPPKAYYDPDGTFAFNLPTADLKALHSVTASGALGVPVPQQASPLPDGSGFITKTAFKPGETQLAVSYEIGYDAGRYVVTGQTFHRFQELLVFIAPPDIEVTADGWENLGVEPQGRFAAIRMRDVDRGVPYRFELSGGSNEAGQLTSPSESAAARTNAPPAGPVTRIPDDTRASKWVLVVLMAAALGYGLLATLYPPSSRRS